MQRFSKFALASVTAFVLASLLATPNSQAQDKKGKNGADVPGEAKVVAVTTTDVPKNREVVEAFEALPGSVLRAGTKFPVGQFYSPEDFGDLPVPLPGRKMIVVYVLPEDVTLTEKLPISAGTQPAEGTKFRSDKEVKLALRKPATICLPSGTKLDGKTSEINSAQALKEIQVLGKDTKSAKSKADDAASDAADAKVLAMSALNEAKAAKILAQTAKDNSDTALSELAALKTTVGQLGGLKADVAQLKKLGDKVAHIKPNTADCNWGTSSIVRGWGVDTDGNWYRFHSTINGVNHYQLKK